MNGIGGDLFAIVLRGDRRGKLHGLNASGWAPTGLDAGAAARRRASTQMPQTGIYSVTVPGAVAGWEAMRARFGTLPLADLLAPAIFYAERRLSGLRRHRRATGAACDAQAGGGPERARDLPAGRPRAARPAKCSGIRDLAASLRAASREQGRDGFYEGQTADAISRSRASTAAR